MALQLRQDINAQGGWTLTAGCGSPTCGAIEIVNNGLGHFNGFLGLNFVHLSCPVRQMYTMICQWRSVTLYKWRRQQVNLVATWRCRSSHGWGPEHTLNFEGSWLFACTTVRLLRHADCRLTRPVLKACATTTEGVRSLMLKVSNLLPFRVQWISDYSDETVLRKRYLLNWDIQYGRTFDGPGKNLRSPLNLWIGRQ
jgi:hypothetical protein